MKLVFTITLEIPDREFTREEIRQELVRRLEGYEPDPTIPPGAAFEIE